jgi:hypothetical protein
MNQYMALHWGQVKAADIFAIGTGTYRGRITKGRGCVSSMEQPIFIMRIAASSLEYDQELKLNDGKHNKS